MIQCDGAETQTAVRGDHGTTACLLLLPLVHRRLPTTTNVLILKPLKVDWSVAGAKIPAVTFITPAGLATRELAHMLDSLVRVSRRVE